MEHIINFNRSLFSFALRLLPPGAMTTNFIFFLNHLIDVIIISQLTENIRRALVLVAK